MDTLTHQTIKGYEFHERIGTGGFGAVYRASQHAVGREVAIKVILPQYANLPDFIRSFEVEAQFIARLEHPHIVPLYDYWRDPKGAYLVMRWLRMSLRASLKRGRWSLQDTARLIDQITSALDIAHREGIIHRDIKPDNILLDEDNNAYLADFGIAKDVHLRNLLEANEGGLIGSPAYVSPEQIRSEDVSSRSDIYTLGYVVYEMLTGDKPFLDAKLPSDYIQKHLTATLPMMSIAFTHIPAAVDEVLQTATAKSPSHRYATALRFAAAFRAALPSNLPRIPAQPLMDALTERELEVLSLMTAGLGNSEIAERLYLTPGTVKWYVKQIYSKLDVHSRQQAIQRAENLQLLKRGAVVIPKTSTADIATVRGLEPPEPLVDPINPYKGLHAFQEADASDFFGRAGITEQLLSRLSEKGDSSRFLVVVGPSGSGKSSLVRAGLLPALRSGALASSPHPFIIDLLPGTHPLEELEAALLRVSINPLPDLLDKLRADRRGLVRAAKLLLPNDQETELIVLVDQFEEVFTLVTNEAMRMHFIDNLLSAATDPRGRVRVILTLRADFYDRPLLYPRLADLVRANTEVVVPLSGREMEQAIVAPAQRVGLQLEAGLVTTILSDVAEQPGTLPLLQYALTELYERREGTTLTLAAYQTMGGVMGALARRADESYQMLDPVGQTLAQQVFLRLVTLGEGTEDTRRRTLMAEVRALGEDNAIDDVINIFAEYRLLTLDHDPITRGPTVEIAHEALLREWTMMKQWLTDSRDQIRIQRRLGTAATEWVTGKDASYLASGVRLAEFESWAAETRLKMTQDERLYLDASIAERDRQTAIEQERQAREEKLERRSVTFLHGLVGVLLMAMIGALVLTSAAIRSADEAQTNFTLSTSRELAAASVNNLEIDPERSLLLALQAVRTTYDRDGTWTLEAEEALHRAIATSRARHVLEGHSGTLTDMDYSPDGERIVTSSVDGTAHVWDAETGEALMVLHPSVENSETASEATALSEVYSVAYSPDGKFIATGSRGGSVIIWDAGTGELLHVIKDFDSSFSVTAVDYSPNGGLLVAVATESYNWGGNLQVVMWDTIRYERQFTFSDEISLGDADFFTNWGDGAFSPNNQYLALATGFEVTLWDIEKSEQVLSMLGHTRTVEDIAFSPDGSRIATVSDDGAAKVWDISLALDLGVPSTTELFTIQGNNAVSYSPDGRYLITGSEEGIARVWDAQSGTPLMTLSGHVGQITDAAFSPDGTRIATAGSDITARIWNATRSEELFTVIFQEAVGNENIGTLDYSPDGTRIAAVGFDRYLRVLDALTGEQVFTYYLGDYEAVTWLEYNADGTRLGITVLEKAIVVDAETGETILDITGHEGRVDGITFSPDGKLIATGGLDDKTARIWDAVTGEEVAALVGHTSGIHCLAFSPDSRYVISGGDDRRAIVWDWAADKQLFTIPIQSSVVTQVIYSPDGTRIATASLEGVANIWDSTTGELVLSLTGHPGTIWGAKFSPDGTRIATTGGSAAKFWDTETGDALITLYGHSDEVLWGDFSPDGQHFATVAQDNSLRVYLLRMEDLLALANTRKTRGWTLEECQRYLHRDTCPADI